MATAVHPEITREINLLLTRILAEQPKTGNVDLEAVELALGASWHQAGAMALTAWLQCDAPSANERQMPWAGGHPARSVGFALQVPANHGGGSSMLAALLSW
jgi:hypothetical protein